MFHLDFLSLYVWIRHQANICLSVFRPNITHDGGRVKDSRHETHLAREGDPGAVEGHQQVVHDHGDVVGGQQQHQHNLEHEPTLDKQQRKRFLLRDSDGGALMLTPRLGYVEC